MFGDPSAQRAVSRILRAIESDIQTCETNGQKTQGAFSAWKDYVDVVKEAMVATQSQLTSIRYDRSIND
jgi:hypothetical protein